MNKLNKATNIVIHLLITFVPVVNLFLLLCFGMLGMCGIALMQDWVGVINRLGIPMTTDVGYGIFYTILIGTPILGACACVLRLFRGSDKWTVKLQILVILLMDLLVLGRILPYV